MKMQSGELNKHLESWREVWDSRDSETIAKYLIGQNVFRCNQKCCGWEMICKKVDLSFPCPNLSKGNLNL